MSEGDEKVKLPDMRKFWDPESKTADERFKEFLSMVADASGLPPAVINALTIGAGIVTVIIGNTVLFKNKAGKVLATKDIDELKNPRVRGNETPPLRNELDDYLDDVGDFYENDVFGHYYDEWPELEDYFDELARYSEDIDVGSVK